ncbi:MAG: ankyrin repeat domain-containing protein, partial [Gammaproteobacteria bacterium]
TDKEDLSPQKVLSYALNEAVKTLVFHEPAPLFAAAMQGKEDEVANLLTQEVDVNERAAAGWNALLAATAQGYPKIMKRLLDAGANPDIGNLHSITPIMYAARYGNVESCKLLLDYGADINLQDWSDQTALMVATRTGHVEVAAMLIDAGADLTIKDEESRSALDICTQLKQGQIAKLIRAASKKRQQLTNLNL